MLQHPQISRALGAVWTAAWLCALTSAAHADDPKPAAPKGAETVASEVIVILAREAEGSVDPSLASIKALKQPPFNAFKSMKILSRTAVSLSTEASSVDLPNGRRLQLTLLERRPDGRTKVQVSINKPGQQDYLPLLQVIASAGEPFFVAGQKHEGGTLVIGVRVGEAPAAK
jgi:hypothetical protein